MNVSRRVALTASIAIAISMGPAHWAWSKSATELNAEADATLELLKETQPVTDHMIQTAKGILIFPEIVKGGLLIGAADGKGVLRVGGKTDGYYRSTAVS